MRFFVFAFLVLTFAACSRGEKGSAPAPLHVDAPFWRNVTAEVRVPTADPNWEKRWWLEKTVRLFRGGEGFRAGEGTEELLKLEPADVVAKLASDPRFGDTVLDFNIYFLGFKSGSLRVEKGFNPQVYLYPNAIDGAREALNGGDYFKLFDLVTPFFFPHVRVLDRKDDEKNVPNLDLFRKRYAAFQESEKAVLDFAKTDTTATLAEVCNRELKHINNFQEIVLMGIPLNFLLDVMVEEPTWYAAYYDHCPAKPDGSLAKLTAALEGIQAKNAALFRELESFADDAYQADGVGDIRVLDAQPLGITKKWISWGTVQRNALPNSSTNMDRKRAAYVLKRFFCDDLTPVGIEDGGDHTGGGTHASQPSCRACHYKLDPMAGFFRTYGRRFQDFSDLNNITFDDNAKTKMSLYMTNWKGTNGRAWDVGYVRSVSDESLNDYASTLGDLHALFRRAPEVKACLVKRAFEYGVGESQTLDPGFLAGITDEFSARAAASPGKAVRWLFGQVALSQTFRKSNPDANTCYDLRPGVDPSKMPPCRVAYLLEHNCKSCHKSTSDHGSLDLTSWAPGPDGKLTFPHLGSDGKPLDARHTLQAIVDALITNDPDDRMPKGKYMSAQDRQALYLWASGQLQKETQ